MNYKILIFLFFLLCGILALNSSILITEPEFFNTSAAISLQKKQLLFSYTATATYLIEAEILPEKKLLEVREKIIWINTTSFNTNELYIHLYANGYKNNESVFSQRYHLDNETRTEINISKMLINSNESGLIYYSSEPYFPNDSTVAKIKLDFIAEPGDSVIIEFDYSMVIPKSVNRLGYATGREFYFLSQWYPKLGVFQNGEWICSPYYPNTNYFSDFADYEVQVVYPSNYILGSTGSVIGKSNEEGRIRSQIVQKGVHDFVWFITDEVEFQSINYRRADSSIVKLNLFLQPEHEKYAGRYFNAITYGLDYIEKNIGNYPYDVLTCLDVPRTSEIGAMEYPTLFTVHTDLFSREKTLKIEEVAIHELVHQYFYGIVANNEVYEAWLDEGITAYLTTKLVFLKYGAPYVTFNFLDDLFIEGKIFFSYNEIPLIYTLGDYVYPEGYSSYEQYYSCPAIGAISDSSYLLPTINSYYVNSYNKPELMLLSLEKVLGFDKMLKIFKRYFAEYKFKHPTARDFIDIVQKESDKDLRWFFEAYYSKASIFDYSVSNIEMVGQDECEVFVTRLADGIVKNVVALYTEKDTLYQSWDGVNTWNKLRFKTKNRVVGAEIDPRRENLFDINFSNNSYLLENYHLAAFSLSLKWFFWVQNALLIMGSIG